MNLMACAKIMDTRITVVVVVVLLLLMGSNTVTVDAAQVVTSSSSIVGEGDMVLSVTGSGPPAPCLELMMDLVQERASVPTRITYRKIQNQTAAHEELIQSINATASSSSSSTTTTTTTAPSSLQFGTGYQPLTTTSMYQQIPTSVSESVHHFPYSLHAIGLYHNIPALGDHTKLNLTACMLAKIFSNQLTSWDVLAITDENPNFNTDDLNEILLVRSNNPSMETTGFTQYLAAACSDHWPWTMLEDTISWPSQYTACAKDISECLEDLPPGAMAFINVAEANAYNRRGGSTGKTHSVLFEVPLRNQNGKYMTSKQSSELGGLEAAVSSLPQSTSSDFSQVSLIYQSGPDTWPIVVMNYIIASVQQLQSELLLTLVKALYEPSYMFQCVLLFETTPVPDQVRDFALQGLSDSTSSTSATPWYFETDIDRMGEQLPSMEQQLYSVSDRRESFSHALISKLQHEILSLRESEIPLLNQQLKDLQTTVADLVARIHVLEEQRSENSSPTAAATTVAASSPSHPSDFVHDAPAPSITTTPSSSQQQPQQQASSSVDGKNNNGDTGPVTDAVEYLDDDTTVTAGFPLFTDAQQNQLQAALVMAVLSFACWIVYIIYTTWRFFLEPIHKQPETVPINYAFD